MVSININDAQSKQALAMCPMCIVTSCDYFCQCNAWLIADYVFVQFSFYRLFADSLKSNDR